MYDGDIAKRHAGSAEYPSSPGCWADEIEQRIIRAYFQLVRGPVIRTFVRDVSVP